MNRMQYTAVILAAGYGSRIKELTKDPKSLLKIKGTTLIEWHLKHLDKLGINKIIIVVGYKDEKIIDQVGLAEYNTTIEFVRNTDYKNKGNGYSLYLGVDTTNLNDNIITNNKKHLLRLAPVSLIWQGFLFFGALMIHQFVAFRPKTVL